MRNLKIGCRIVFLCGLICVGIYIIWENSLLSNLEKRETTVNAKWHEVFKNSSNRITILKKWESGNSKNLTSALTINFKERGKYKDNNALQFAKIESDLNEQILKAEPYMNDDILKLIRQNDEKLNSVVEEYNSLVLEYNKYITVFPNFYIAKKEGFKRKKFFEIVYGKHNEDPVKKAEEVPDWMWKIEKSKGL